MTATATWLRSAEIVSQDEAEAFFASRILAKPFRFGPDRPARQRSASLSGTMIKR